MNEIFLQTELDDGTPVEVFAQIDVDSLVVINEINVDGDVFDEEDFKEEFGRKQLKKLVEFLEMEAE